MNNSSYFIVVSDDLFVQSRRLSPDSNHASYTGSLILPPSIRTFAYVIPSMEEREHCLPDEAKSVFHSSLCSDMNSLKQFTGHCESEISSALPTALLLSWHSSSLPLLYFSP